MANQEEKNTQSYSPITLQFADDDCHWKTQQEATKQEITLMYFTKVSLPGHRMRQRNIVWDLGRPQKLLSIRR